jgi:beta-galactosidase/beta-glucuronidase
LFVLPELHSIRLHGPWHATVLEWLSPRTDVEPQHPVKIPSDWGDWLGTLFRGRVKYQRNFGLPTGLTDDQKVWLVVEAIDYRANVVLNDRPLGSLQLGDPPLRFEVRHSLKKSNRLQIEVELPVEAERGQRNGLAGGLIGSVRLEIEDSLTLS